MLRFIREKFGKIGVYLFFVPIIVVFVAWGVERFDRPMGSAVAVVNGESITYTQYNNALQQIINFYQQMMQGNFDERAQKQFRVKEQALQQLVQTLLISEQAKKMGIYVTDDAIRKQILAIPAFQKDGQFSKANYNAFLNYSRMSASQFEDSLRKELLIDRTRQLFEDGVMTSLSESEKEKQLADAKLDVEFLKISKEKAEKVAPVSDAQVNEFLAQENNKGKVKEYYDIHAPEFNKEERVRARHILIRAKKGDAKEEQAAKEKIAKIQAELKSSSFEALAKKYSDDPGSKTKGGDLDFFEKGRMVPEFEVVAFSAPVGKVSDPVQTAYGFHLILVIEKRPAETKTLEQASKQIARSILAQEWVNKKISEVDKLLPTDPKAALADFQSVDKGAAWESTGVFSVSEDRIPKLVESEDISAAVFSLSPEKPVASRLIQVGKEVYALRYKSASNVAKTQPAKGDVNAGRTMGRGLFGSWSSQLIQSAKIQTNPMLMAEGGQ